MTLIPFSDYQRIYQIAYSVLEASGVANTPRACIFFAAFGVMVLREHYKLNATISMGGFALMVDQSRSNVVVYGHEVDGVWSFGVEGFHAWVECDGWVVDFMAPIMGLALRGEGGGFTVPRKMFQKPLSAMKHDLHALERSGDFFCSSDSMLANLMLDRQGVQFSDLLHVCMAWFRKPPKTLPPIALAATGMAPKQLVLTAPPLEGAW